MKMKMLKKSKIWVAIFLVILSLTLINVQAKEVQCDEELLIKKYDLKYNDSKKQFELPAAKESKLKGVKFKLVSVSGKEVSGDYTLTVGTKTETLAFDLKKYSCEPDNEGVFCITKVIFETENEPDCMDPENKVAGKVKITYELYSAIDAGISGTDGSEEEVWIAEPTITTNPIDCKKTQTGLFEQNFCFAKQKAKEMGAGHYEEFGEVVINDSFSNKTVRSNKCSLKLQGNKATMKSPADNDSKEEDYYVNYSYYYGQNIKHESRTYTYHLAPDNILTPEVSCKLVCEEAVVVKYGPPIAQKAGGCFQYKVKIESRVTCNMAKAPAKPMKKPLCTPTPVCTNSSGSYFVNQGGPSEDFDNCIKQCDGGKYSENCSKKCYKKVYGNNSSKTLALYDTAQVKPMAAWNGQYRWGNGNVTWDGSSAGRWYYYPQSQGNKCHNGGCYPEYKVLGNGIFRHDYGVGSFCQDNCWWSTGTCSNPAQEYLNPEAQESDLTANTNTYNELITACKAQASCSTTTAKYTMKAKYNTVDNEVLEIVYPYESAPDSLRRTTNKIIEKSIGDICLDSERTNPEGYKVSRTKTQINCGPHGTTLLEYAGCYNENTDNQNYYMTEWTFPGTYVNIKNGNYRLEKPTNTNQYLKVNGKVCLPYDIKNTNAEWWNWIECGDGKKESSAVPNNIKQIFNSNSYSSHSSQGFNILAHAEDFGYYKWNIDVECFYATYDNKTRSDETTETNSCGGNTTLNYSVRTVDIGNMFPNSSIDESKSGVVTDENKREIGWNWTEAAKLPDDKIGNQSGYNVNPDTVAKEIQASAKTLYSNPKYLDYHFHLNRDKIQTLRSHNKSCGLSTYCGDYVYNSSTGFYVYQSDVLRNQKIKETDVLPEIGINDK